MPKSKDDKDKKNFFNNFSDIDDKSKNNNWIKELSDENLDLDRKNIENSNLKENFAKKVTLLKHLTITFYFIILCSFVYVSILLWRLNDNKDIIYILGTFTLSVTLALIFLFATVFKSMFITNESKEQKENEENKDISINKILEPNPILKEISDKVSSILELVNKKK